MSKIAIILPNFNDSRFIINWMKKFENQWPDEVIFVDDNSTDNSLKLVSHLQDMYFPLHVLQNEEKKGCFGALITACKHTDAEFISVWSCDDDVNPGYMNQMRAAIERYPLVDLFSCNANVIREGKEYKRILLPFDSYLSPDYTVKMFQAGYARNFNIIGNVIRRSVVQKFWDAGGKDMNANFDGMYCYSTMFSKGFVNLGDRLVTYRSYPNSFGAKGKWNEIQKSIRICKKIYSDLLALYTRAEAAGVWGTKAQVLSQIALRSIMLMPKWSREKFYDWLYSYDYRVEKL